MSASHARAPWWSLRLRVVWITLAAVLLVAVAAGCVMLGMPGRSFEGPSPPLGDEDAALRAELERDVRALAEEIGDRSVFRPERMEAAARHCETAFAAAGLTPQREPFAAVGQTFVNVVAEVRGAARAQEIVVVGGHYDTVRGSPGANDNATGVAATLALARRLAASRPARTLRFVAFACEEPPCFQTEQMGSLVHARAAKARGDDVVAMVSLETLGCFRDEPGSQEFPVRGMDLVFPSTGNFVAFVGDVGSRGLVRDTIRVFREHARVPSEGAALPNGVPGVGWSDHWSFWQVGVPALMVTDTAIFRDDAYHDAHDLPGRVDFDRLAHVVRGLVPVVASLVKPAPP
jgi:hypothetical protein